MTRQVLVLSREDPAHRWEIVKATPDTDPALCAIAGTFPRLRGDWLVIPLVEDNRDGHGLSICRWHWESSPGRSSLCTRPIGHGSVHVNRATGATHPAARPVVVEGVQTPAR